MPVMCCVVMELVDVDPDHPCITHACPFTCHAMDVCCMSHRIEMQSIRQYKLYFLIIINIVVFEIFILLLT